MVLDKLSNTQLARVFNAVTGQTVSKFTNNAIGLKRVRKALEQHSVTPEDAIEMAGIKPRDDVRSAVTALPPDPVPEAPAEKVEGKDYAITTDKWGYKHRKPLGNGKQPKAKGERKPGNKMEVVLGLLAKGTTVPAIMEATGWLPHTTRAYLSKGGALRKAGITVVSEKVTGEDGKKTTYYRVGA